MVGSCYQKGQWNVQGIVRAEVYSERTGECAKESGRKSPAEKSFEKFPIHRVNYLVVVIRVLVQMFFLPSSDSVLLLLTSTSISFLALSDSA